MISKEKSSLHDTALTSNVVMVVVVVPVVRWKRK
jgi:hypothetical protein